MEALIPISLFVVMAVIVKTIFDYKTRRALLEKGQLSVKVEPVVMAPAVEQNLSSLKWGLILTAIGAAIVIGTSSFSHDTEENTISLMFLFAGLALIFHYFIAGRVLRKRKQESNPA